MKAGVAAVMTEPRERREHEELAVLLVDVPGGVRHEHQDYQCQQCRAIAHPDERHRRDDEDGEPHGDKHASPDAPGQR